MHKPRTFFIVDDDIDDQELFIEAVSEVDRSISCIPVSNCEEALAVLKSTKTDLPDMIFLDLNMPLKDGRQALREIKSNPDFRAIPTVILSTSQNEDDIAACYDLGANSYIVKPASYSDLLGITDTLRQYWMDTVELSIKRERHDKYRP